MTAIRLLNGRNGTRLLYTNHANTTATCLYSSGCDVCRSTTPLRKRSNCVWLPPTSNQNSSSHSFAASCFSFGGCELRKFAAQLSQFKQATQFGTRRRPISRTCSYIRGCGIQVQSRLPAHVRLVRVLIGVHPVSIRTINPRSRVFVVEGFFVYASHDKQQRLSPGRWSTKYSVRERL